MITYPKTEKEINELFEKAISCGRLSIDPSAENFAGDYMFMGIENEGREDEKILFKNINTRHYLP